ncbi:MAG: decaprenyl-phosphate phosphoribosyltransferase [Fimbriimonadaceae bacterium]
MSDPRSEPNQRPEPEGSGRSVGAHFRLLRPKQWTKNLLVPAAFIFTDSFRDPRSWQLTAFAFVVMCAVSSATYIVNDLRDTESDRAHPKKRLRPLAARQVLPSTAVAMAVVLVLVAVGLLVFFLPPTCSAIVGLYLLMQLAYNCCLKNVPIADVFTIALGFVLRAAMGAAALSVSVSAWLLICTGALALMLGFAKRRNEFIAMGERRTESRQSLSGYSRPALDALVVIMAGLSAMAYGLYSVESSTAQKYPGLVVTTFFVAYGISRYVLLVFSKDEGGEPADILVHDRHILTSVALFLVFAVLAVSGVKIPLIE